MGAPPKRIAERLPGPLRLQIQRRIVWPLGASPGQIVRAYRLRPEDIATPSNSNRFIGGLTGRSGTTWLGRTLAMALRHELAVMNENGVFVLAQFRGAPYELFQVARSDPTTRRAYLAYFRRFMRTYGYRRRRMYATGLRGLSPYVPKRAIDLAWKPLVAEVLPAQTLEDAYLAFGRFYGRLLNFYSLSRAGTSTWISREPPYGRHVDELVRMIPDARVVIMARDGRDVVSSMLEQGWVSRDVVQAMERWRTFTRMTLDAVDRVPEHSYHLVRYEDMVNDFETTMSGVVEFLGVGDPATVVRRCLEAGGRYVPRGTSLGRWRDALDPGDVAYFAERCGDLMQRLGYEL